MIKKLVEVVHALEAINAVYLKKPFHKKSDFATTSVNYDIAELLSGAETVYNDLENKLRGGIS